MRVRSLSFLFACAVAIAPLGCADHGGARPDPERDADMPGEPDPPEMPEARRMAHAGCAAAGRASADGLTAVECTAPAELSVAGRATNEHYVWQPGPLFRLSPTEARR